MNISKRLIALTELVLVLPASLFMTALIARSLQPTRNEPATSAQRLVDWFGARPFLCLDIFLIALPFAVLVIGSATVIGAWRRDAAFRQAAAEMRDALRAHMATLVIAAITIISAGILLVVAVHVLTD